ncbi:hypothetical protein [Pseudoalteromonas arabiensis]|uniref:hypothetical protein n=1 Tax=Pseudoalteromonas arabiensis TaxID=874454 RepID=UPI0007841530|nr:hypothetical protein [Pseudoalteromonas arabiensis]
MRLTTFCFVVIAIFVSVKSNYTSASTAIFWDVQIASYNFPESDLFSVTSQSESNFDTLALASSSLSDVSISFNSFIVDSKALYIYIPADSLIEKLSIRSQSFSFNNVIKVIGKPIDIIFISTSNNFSCNGCSFENIGRLTFVNGTFSSDIIDVRSGSIISLNNLKAPGIQSLEVFSDSINTAGVIDLNLNAVAHPEGGYIISNQGNLVAGAGGINLYSGSFRIKYSDLDIISVNTSTGTFSPQGTFKAASIGIVSAKNVEIPINTELNTMSDLLATSTRQGSFYAPSEGIFIQVAKHPSAAVTVKGKLYSDNIITTKSISNQTFHNSARVMGQAFKSLTKGVVSNYGLIEADIMGINGSKFINSGSIRGAKLDVESAGDVYNSFGGEILVGLLSIKIDDGIFVNGSRTNKLYRPSKLAIETPVLDMTSTKHGLYNFYTESGTVQSNLAANIHANEIRVSANAIENINPYNLKKGSSESWDSGIRVNTTFANQVSLIAENYLGLKASNYIRNSSAILGLEQRGDFEVNTPKFYNERYRLEADSFIVSQLTYDSINTGKYNEATVGSETKVIAYSPPGRIYSYGKLKVSDGNSINEDEEFINAFSYVEIFGDSHFHQLELKTVGLELTKVLSESSVVKIRSCMMWGNCASNVVTSHAEAETLFSLQGNVYGLNQDIVSESNYYQDSLNVLEVRTQEVINEYLSQFIYNTSENRYGEVTNIKIEGDILTGTYKECDGQRFIPYIGRYVDNCAFGSFRKSISSLLEAATEDNEVGNTGYSYAQIKQAATKFVKTLPMKSDPNNVYPDIFLTVERMSFMSYALSSDYKTITISYIQAGKVVTPGAGSGYQNYTFRFTETTLLSTVMACLPDSACN